MPGKHYSEHVEGLALEPIGGGPHPNDARDLFAISSTRFHAQAFVLRKRIKVEHDVESLLALWPIYGCQVGKQVEFLFVTQVLRNLCQLSAFDRENRLLAILNGFDESRSKLSANPSDQLIVERSLQLHGRLWRNGCGGFCWSCAWRRGGCRFGRGSSCRTA